jgi:hypothetical protein
MEDKIRDRLAALFLRNVVAEMSLILLSAAIAAPVLALFLALLFRRSASDFSPQAGGEKYRCLPNSGRAAGRASWRTGRQEPA